MTASSASNLPRDSTPQRTPFRRWRWALPLVLIHAATCAALTYLLAFAAFPPLVAWQFGAPQYAWESGLAGKMAEANEWCAVLAAFTGFNALLLLGQNWYLKALSILLSATLLLLFLFNASAVPFLGADAGAVSAWWYLPCVVAHGWALYASLRLMLYEMKYLTMQGARIPGADPDAPDEQ